MIVTFLGTGTSQGVPIIGCNHPVCLSKNPKDKRLRSSVLIKWLNAIYAIDCGPDFRQQMLATSTTSLNGILFTHEHADHTAGLDDIRPFSNAHGPLPIYGSQRLITQLEARFAYIFEEKNRYEGAPAVEPKVIDTTPFSLSGKTITPIEVWHGNLRIMGYMIDRFAYLTDVKYVDEETIDKLKNLDILVVNALRIEPHPTHFNLREALDFVEKVSPKKAYFTHISHRLGFHDEVQKLLPSHVFLAYDGLVVEV